MEKTAGGRRMNKPSAKKQAIYEYIIEFTGTHGYPPSVREIARAVGLRSPGTVHAHLSSLAEQGLIRKDGRKPRALSVARPPDGVPIVGKVTAGLPVLAFEEDQGRLPYRVDDTRGHFALRVRGDSMTGAGILDGDYVVVRRQPSAESGEVVVALLGDEAAVKRLRIAAGRVSLLSENPAYEPIDGTDCSLLGRVVAVVREL
jgi:repressor LexA